MEKFVHLFTASMSKAWTFFVIAILGIVSSGIGLLLNLGDGYMAMVNVAISVFTMITAQGLQVSGTRDTLAIHLKLDTIIKHLDIPDDEIGDEKETERELTKRKQKLEQEAN